MDISFLAKSLVIPTTYLYQFSVMVAPAGKHFQNQNTVATFW
jgi:hypothetical protein